MAKRSHKAPLMHVGLLLLAAGAIAACGVGSDGSGEDKQLANVLADGITATNVSVTPGNGSATARFTVNTSRSTTFSELVLAVRDEADGNFDFAHQGNVIVNGSRTFTGTSGSLANGKYTAWVAYTLDGSNWSGLEPTTSFTVGGAGPVDAGPSPVDSGSPPVDAGTPPPPPGKRVVFNAPFSDSSQWTVGRSSAYPGATNPGDNKLDYISPSNGPDADGTFRATKRSDGNWNADLVTTEYSAGKFELKPGDELDATVTLGPEIGAWPAIWTWGRDLPSGVQPGHGEVDLFEYHPNNADLLELSNHVREGHLYYRNANIVKAGKPFELKVIFGSQSVDWYLNNTLVYADGKGVPSNWVAYPIVNLSVCAGQYHPAPAASQTSMSYKVTNFRVYR